MEKGRRHKRFDKKAKFFFIKHVLREIQESIEHFVHILKYKSAKIGLRASMAESWISELVIGFL